jgi:hypothetical protein
MMTTMNRRSEVVHTHTLVFTASTVTKHYVSWRRGEHLREWATLRQVWRYAPDLAPRPLAADLDSHPPRVTMSVVPGEQLRGTPTDGQIDALRTAIASLWRVSPDARGIGAWSHDLAFGRQLVDGPRPEGGAAAAAYDAAVAWWEGPDPELLRTRPRATVLGHRDPNLANYLWDGHRVRIVDFEDAAHSDPATEVALLAEHLSTREMDADRLCARFDVDGMRLMAARRLWAMYWLRRLLSRGAAEHQAERLLKLLGVRNGVRRGRTSG